ncbi:GST-like protein yncG [Raoultella ornithinolytica]|nr:GST-like protein yncG [Raoultella ornithinolytica]
MITVYGVPGWGSAIGELMLTLANIPYHFVNVAGFDQPGPQRDSLMQINPLCQVPTLRLADGSVMTETAAMALMILDSRPDLAPAPGTAQRHQFQRLLIWLVANVYPTFTYADYPQRWGRRCGGATAAKLHPLSSIAVPVAGAAAGGGALCAGGGDNPAGLLYCDDVPLGSAAGVVFRPYAEVCRRG